ncbi:DUF1990 domain-containing protein [Nocardioides sp. 1609]|uniref:DUF1990 family protein n=1 Tax=Nocardioides sp. 1609 TaxID=2508327 RepID=UPI00107067D9|nr:DUF1990 domain-containing protein [Nocardioides sp. 1609]
MSVGKLPAPVVAVLQAAPFTYAEVGASATGPQAGYHWLERTASLARRDFEEASRDLFEWRLHERSGLRVQASDSPLRQGTVVLMHLGLGPASIRIPCRVASVIAEPTRRGFAYGTLPGHPESGEESFVLDQDDSGTITLAITAFSKPASRLARLGGPLGRRVQHTMTTRYLRALDRRS